MLISVIYPNGKHDMVKETYLTYLIDAEKIDMFRRSEGWVSIYAPDVRGKVKHATYAGPERRIQEIISSGEDIPDALISKSLRDYLSGTERANSIQSPLRSTIIQEDTD